MPQILPGSLVDRRDVTLAGATTRSFWLQASEWEYPDFENAEAFVGRLERSGLLAHNTTVDALRGERRAVSLRSAQRHFLRGTGLTCRVLSEIERARHATNLLRDGVSILDTVHEAGYFDHGHLTRSLKYRVGQTPTEIIKGDRQLSFLYKTTAFR